MTDQPTNHLTNQLHQLNQAINYLTKQRNFILCKTFVQIHSCARCVKVQSTRVVPLKINTLPLMMSSKLVRHTASILNYSDGKYRSVPNGKNDIENKGEVKKWRAT